MIGRRRTARRWPARSEAGQAAGVETIPFGILLLVGGTLLATNAWAVVDTRAALDAAARDYLRAYTAAPTSAAGRDAGRAAARASLDARAFAARAHIEDPATPFGPCRPAGVRISLEVPGLRIPFTDGIGTTTVSTEQTELIQPYGVAIDEAPNAGPSPCR